MAATVYAPPDGIKIPVWEDELVDADGQISFEKMRAGEQAFIARCRKWLAANGYTGELAGEHVRWPQGHDSYARYLVMKIRPLWLMFLPLGEARNLDDMRLRGLRLADVRENIELQAKLAAIGIGEAE